MREQDLVQDTYEDLTDIYSEDRILVEPVVDTKLSFRPDIGILDESTDEFLVLIECSALTTQHREREDIKQVRDLMKETDTPYGAIVSKSFRYVFELIDINGYELERELPRFPGADSDQRRPLSSPEEVRFKFWRLSEHFPGMAQFELVKRLYYALFRKLAAERHGRQLEVQTLTEQGLEEIDALIEEQYPPFSPQTGGEEDVKFQSHVLAIFNGIDLERTPRHLSQEFVEIGDKEKSGFQSTPLWVSEALVDMTDVGDGDVVIDPAAGIGTILRDASFRGASAYAVEINQDAANSGIFLNELFDTEISYTLGDYFVLSENAGLGESFPTEFDYGFIDPPFGHHHERSDGKIVRSVEEQFVLETLDQLKAGGTLTAILPAGKLYQQRATDFRETLLSEYTIDSLIEIQPPIYERAGISTVIIQVQKKPMPSDHEISYTVIDSGEDPEKQLPSAVEDIQSGTAPTLSVDRLELQSFLPSEITQLDEVDAEIKREYSDIKELQAVANDIRVGTQKPDNVYESPGEDRLPYVNIRDLNKGEFGEYVSESDDIVTADETDVLVSKSGTKIHVYHPAKEIAPSSMWAVIRFSSEQEALVYAHFLDSDLARQQLEAVQSGSTILHIPIRRLREILVPEFTAAEISEKSDEIREKLDRLSELEEKQAELQDELGDLFLG